MTVTAPSLPEILPSYVAGSWWTPSHPSKVTDVTDANTGARLTGVSTDGLDTAAAIEHARTVGQQALGELTIHERALKLKELAYIHAEGFAAGELKHGPIALIDDGQPVFVVMPSPLDRHSLHAKVVSNIQEVRARGARTFAVAERGDAAVRGQAEVVFEVPETQPMLMPLLTTVPLQIFAMELATAKGLDVDQPRNLAKSVTVE